MAACAVFLIWMRLPVNCDGTNYVASFKLKVTLTFIRFFFSRKRLSV